MATLFSLATFSQVTELYFSKYGEGSSNNKFIEIYNGTSEAISLDEYAFPNVSNAPSVVGEYEFWNTFPEGSSIAAGDVFVIAHSSADAQILAVADMTFNFLSNGDDGFALVKGTEELYAIIDWLGNWDGDPGTGWDVAGVAAATANHTLTRKSSVCGPNTDWAASAGTDADTSEWIVGDSDSGWSTLGSYSGCLTDPTITITSPSNGVILDAGTTDVDVSFTTENETTSAVNAFVSVNGGTYTQYNIVTNPFTIPSLSDGDSVSVYVAFDDNSATSDTITFEINLPCYLSITDIMTSCNSETNADTDLYTATLAFTGGGSSQYTIETNGIGTISGDDPSSVENGTITISGITEGTDFGITITGDASNSSCNIERTIYSPTCLGTVSSCPAEGSIIITEVMQNPNASFDSNGEYFEVYNTTSEAIDMVGWLIKDESSETEVHTISTSLIVPANDYVVLAINSDTNLNGGVIADYVYDNISLGNGTDGLILECLSGVIDSVTWDNGTTFPDPTGASMELAVNKYNASENDNGANWSEATSSLSGGDLGTPGMANDFTLSTKSNEIEGFAIYPNPVTGDFLTITSASSSDKFVAIYSVFGQEVLSTSISGSKSDISVTSLTSGVYILKVVENGKTATSKIIID